MLPQLQSGATRPRNLPDAKGTDVVMGDPQDEQGCVNG
jgi:hypothetical protein